MESRGHKLTLKVDRTTGKTVIEKDEISDRQHGLGIRFRLPGSVAKDGQLANNSIALANHGTPYDGPSSPWWYGPRDLERLCECVKPASATVKDICRDLGFERDDSRQARSLSREDVAALLSELRANCKQIDPVALGPIGAGAFSGPGYAVKAGLTQTPSGAQLPYIVEAWVKCQRPEIKGEGDANITLVLNRSQTVAKIAGFSYSKEIIVDGCGLDRRIRGQKVGLYTICLSVISPYIQLASDGKEPQLSPYGNAIEEVLRKACGQAHRAMVQPEKKMSLIDAGFAVMKEAYMLASGDGKLPANVRQVMYACRPKVLELTGREAFSDSDFIQRVIRGYLEMHPEATADWDLRCAWPFYGTAHSSTGGVGHDRGAGLLGGKCRDASSRAVG